MKASSVRSIPPGNKAGHKRAPARVGVLIPALVALLLVQGWVLGRTWLGGESFGVVSLPDGGWWILAQLWAVAASVILLWKLALVASYRPCPSVDDEALPSITVVVPAYNESRQVFETIESLVRSDYPAEKLRIVAVNDGSRDDTWSWMDKARAAHPGIVTAVDCRQNRGKRHALYEGFHRARGSVIVTVDGDSEVLPDTLRNLVSPFVVDPRVGAVAGNVRVLNRDAGALPRMLDVAFTHAFEFMRASESEVDTVQCCPGALCAYRRSLVRAFADRWVVQEFMGRPANIGEDRAMTNLILRSGSLVKFQSSAIVLTEVPTRLGGLCRMFLRWARSNVRESLVLASFVFTRFRPESAVGARINATWALLRIVVAAGLFLPVTMAVLAAPHLAAWLVFGGVASAALPAAIYTSTRSADVGWFRALAGAVWAMPYGVLSVFALSWIGPYALVTPQRSGWLTRGLTAPPPAPSTPALVAEGESAAITMPLRTVQVRSAR